VNVQRVGPSFWYTVAAIATAVEIEAVRKKHREATLSHAWRKACRTDTKLGRVGLVVGWSALSVWLVPHLLRQAENSLEALIDAVTVEA
jgi:hypothetical protein